MNYGKCKTCVKNVCDGNHVPNVAVIIAKMCQYDDDDDDDVKK